MIPAIGEALLHIRYIQKGLTKSFEYVESELGNNIQVILYKPARTRLVKTVYHQDE
jgi:hypothetical protein